MVFVIEKYRWLKSKLTAELCCPEDYYIAAFITGILLTIHTLVWGIDGNIFFTILTICSLLLAGFGFLLEIKEWLIRFFSKSNISAFKILYSVIAAPVLLAISIYTTKAYINNSVEELTPDYYSHSIDILFPIGLITMAIFIFIGILLVTYAICLLDFFWTGISNYIKESAKNLKNSFLAPFKKESDEAKEDDNKQNSETIKYMRLLGCMTILFILLSAFDLKSDLRLLGRYVVFLFDHYDNNACNNIELMSNERIGYNNTDKVSIAAWNGLTDISFKIVKCDLTSTKEIVDGH